MKHELPTFPKGVAKTFKAACEVWSQEMVLSLRDSVKDYISQFEELHIVHEVGDLELAKALAKVSQMLLSRYATLDQEQKALVIGAVRYFVEDNDPLPDTGFASGLVDDAQVMNHVLERLGIEGHFIAIDAGS
jgi:uncharacterized membrane protein YkvA (DUF1232 family)